MNGKIKILHKVLAGKPEGKRQLWTLWRAWKIILK